MSSLMRPTDIFDDFYRPFGSLFTNGLPARLLADSESWLPATDVRQEDEGYVIEMEVPGFQADSINVEAHDNVLTIQGERSSESEETEGENGYIRRERRFGKFARRFTLPPGTDEDKVVAQVKDGVLTVSIPAAKSASPKKIAVE